MIMSFSVAWIRISISLIALCGVFFFYNRKPKFIVPFSSVHQTPWIVYTILLCLLSFSVVIFPLRLAFVSDRQVVVEKDIPVQIILDVSLSMSANDISPSRFSAAKQALISLIEQLDWYYASLIAFSWKPFVYIPFSSESSAIIKKLQSMNLGDFPPVKDFLWTAIGDALLLGVHNLQQFTDQEPYKPWIIILITDGDSNVGFDPLQILSYCQKMHIPLYVLGIWQSDYLIGRDMRNDMVMTNINLPLLQELASKTWWMFYRVLGDDSFDQFVDELSQDILSHQQKKIEHVYREMNRYLIYFVALLVVALLIFRVYLLRYQTKRSQ